MKPIPTPWLWWLQKMLYLLLGTLVVTGLLSAVLAYASDNSIGSGWAIPDAMALRRSSQMTTGQRESRTFSNIDCEPITYRLVSGTDMRQGCFTSMSFGSLEIDSGLMIFTGTDEAIPLLPYAHDQIITAWPQAGNLIAFSPVVNGGMKLRLYRQPFAAIQDRRDLLGQLTAKQLIAPADLPLTYANGSEIEVNAPSVAFSDGGSWLVAETSDGTFVRVNLATLDVRPFAPALQAAGNPATSQSSISITMDGRFVALSNNTYGFFKVYDLQDCAGPRLNPKWENCRSYDYRSFITSQISGLQLVKHVRFINNDLLSFEASTGNSATSGNYVLAPRATITSLLDYMAFGDSYTSGEGAFDYRTGTDTIDNHCHLSTHSYPLLLRRDLFGASSGQSVACSGAVIADISSTGNNYHGQVRDGPSFSSLQQQPDLLGTIFANFTPGYIAQEHFAARYQPRVMTVGIGGNDIGFGDIVQECVMPHASNNECFSSYEDRLEVKQLVDRTGRRLVNTYKNLLAASPGNRLYVIGYPQIVSGTGTCGLNVHLSKAEIVFAGELIAYLNTVVEQAADQAGAIYVDIGQALTGHRLCETNAASVAVNGVTAGKDAGLFGINIIGGESYHPNTLGHELIEQAILRATNNFKSLPAVPATRPSQLLAAPPSGRAIVTRLAGTTLKTTVNPGGTLTVAADGQASGLKPNTTYNLRLDGPTGQVIGSTTTSTNGDITAVILIPAGTTGGGHTIDLVGPGAINQPIDVVTPVYVSQTPTDADGDGIPDDNDSCPTIPNSGQDADHDMIDDACDGSSTPPAGTGQITPPGQATANDATPTNGDPVLSGISTNVTSFDAITQPKPLITSVGAVQGKTLGTTTTNLQPAGQNQQHNQSTQYRARSGAPRVIRHAINWRIFIFLPLMLWLLLILFGIWLSRLLLDGNEQQVTQPA